MQMVVKKLYLMGNVLLAGGSDVIRVLLRSSWIFCHGAQNPWSRFFIPCPSINAKNSSSTSGGNIVIRGSLSNVLGTVSGRAVLVTNSNVLTQDLELLV